MNLNIFVDTVNEGPRDEFGSRRLTEIRISWRGPGQKWPAHVIDVDENIGEDKADALSRVLKNHDIEITPTKVKEIVGHLERNYRYQNGKWRGYMAKPKTVLDNGIRVRVDAGRAEIRY